MYEISAAQIRAARGLLNWTQDDLATASKISRSTIHTLETGNSARLTNLGEILKAFEDNGIEFLEDEGVKRQPETVRTFAGRNSCDKLFAHITKTIKEKGSDVISHIQIKDFLARPCGSTHRTNFARFEELQKITDVKCLLADNVTLPPVLSCFQMRIIPEEQCVLPFANFAYGDYWVSTQQDSCKNFVFIVVQKLYIVSSCQNYFLPRWHAGRPLLVEAETRKRRA